ncbi:TetR family transcriptional regulator [Agromyces seonyuensis]|uniref:TetR family transcriptional regulator n=1 Tax=Agromyces seonyuensis TaxID=2662446 RepID=UPI0019224C0A
MPRPRAFDERAVEDAARERFWSHGYARTTMQDLARATGIGNGSLYAAYGSKIGLFRAVLAQYCGAKVEAVRLALGRGTTPQQAVTSLFHSTIEDCVEQPGRRGCLLLNTVTEAAADETTLGICRSANADMERAIADAIRGAEGLAARDVDLLAAEILVVDQGLIQASRFGADAGELRAIAADYCARLPI